MKTSAAVVRLVLAVSAAGPLMAGNGFWSVAAGFGSGGVSVGVQVGAPAGPAVCPPAPAPVAVPVAVPVACPPPAPVVFAPAPTVVVVHAHHPPRRHRVFHPAAPVWVAPAPVVAVAPVVPPPPMYPVVVAHPVFCR